jgi:virginiamycin B lyase
MVIGSGSWNRVRRVLARAGVWVVVAVAWVAGAAPVPAYGVVGAVTEYGPLPSIPLSGVCETHFDAGGKLWIEQYLSSQVASFDPVAGTFTEHDTPMPLSVPGGMAVGPDGGLWMPEVTGNALLRVDPADGGMHEYRLPWANALNAKAPGLPLHLGLGLANDIATGPDGALWFTLGGLNAIGRYDPASQTFSQYPVPGELLGQVQSLFGIIKPGPGNTVVMDLPQQNAVVTLDVSTHRFTRYTMPTLLSYPVGVWTAGDGSIWVTESLGMKVARIDPASGAIQEFPLFGLGGLLSTVEGDLLNGSLGNPLPLPGPITQGSDGNMYVALSFPAAAGLGNQIAMIDPATHRVRLWWTPSSASYPCDVQGEQAGSIWFGELTPNKVGRLSLG